MQWEKTQYGTVSSKMNPTQDVQREIEEEKLIWARVLEKALQSRAVSAVF